MPSKKLYRIKRELVKELPKVMNSQYPVQAFQEGYVFVTPKGENHIYMISSTATKTSLNIRLVNAEIVD